MVFAFSLKENLLAQLKELPSKWTIDACGRWQPLTRQQLPCCNDIIINCPSKVDLCASITFDRLFFSYTSWRGITLMVIEMLWNYLLSKHLIKNYSPVYRGASQSQASSAKICRFIGKIPYFPNKGILNQDYTQSLLSLHRSYFDHKKLSNMTGRRKKKLFQKLKHPLTNFLYPLLCNWELLPI